MLSKAKRGPIYLQVIETVKSGKTRANVAKIGVDNPCQEFKYLWPTFGKSRGEMKLECYLGACEGTSRQSSAQSQVGRCFLFVTEETDCSWAQ